MAKVRCFLSYKNLPYTTRYVHPLRAQAEIPLGHQVPVIHLDGALHNDSTPIGLLLDDKFAENPLFSSRPATDRSKILEVDAWVTAALVPLCFRLMLGYGGGLVKQMRNGSIGANGLHKTVAGGYPLPFRWLHPLLVPRMKFVRDIIAMSDQNKNNDQLLAAVCQKLCSDLAGYPFLAQQASITLADLSVFSQLALPYLAGYDDADVIEQYPLLMQWLSRVQSQLSVDAALRLDLHRRALPEHAR